MGSLRLGKILGISVELHSTFVLMMVLFVLILAVFDPQNLLQTIGFVLLLFVSVFIHELFHSITAIVKGVKVTKITLLPIGGLSVADELPQKPMDEFLIALAGPAFNFIVVAAVLVIAQFFPQAWPGNIFFDPNVSEEVIGQTIFSYPLFAVFWVNLILGAFNLFVPALPLDGGRVLRALLATRLGFNKATQIASGLSKIISGVLFLLGFFTGNLILVLVAVFVFLGANQENEMVSIKESLSGLNLRDVVSNRKFRLNPEITVKEAFSKMLEKKSTQLLVDMHELSFVTIDMLSKIRKSEQDFVKISELAKPVKSISASVLPERAFSLMLSKNMPYLIVKEKDKILGSISAQDLQKVIEIKKAEKQIN